jgi:hypothetical protein
VDSPAEIMGLGRRLRFLELPICLDAIQEAKSRLHAKTENLGGTIVEQRRLLPTGQCWCGCGEETPVGSFFRQGHDKLAESAIIAIKYGGVAGLLDSHGYGPGGKNARREFERWKKDSGRV